MSNTFRKFMAAVTSVLMALALVPATALADESGSITITPPAGANDSLTYTVYEVFKGSGNGTSISYKLLDGYSTTDSAWTSAKMGDYFDVDSVGNVTAKDVAKGTDGKLNADAAAAVKAYVEGLKLTGTMASKDATGGTYSVSGLEDGYYYVTTSTGSLVSIDSVNGKQQKVDDKNTVPTVDKKITSVKDSDDATAGSVDANGKNAIAQVGSTVSFEGVVTFGKGSKSVKFHDVMSNGLSLNASSIEVYSRTTSNGTTTDTKLTNTAETTYYTVQSTADTGDTFTVSFPDGVDENTVYVVKYTATVTSDALSSTAATNTATVSYGENNKTTGSTVSVYNAKVTVNKTFKNNGTAVFSNYPEAGFKLYKTVNGTKYYYVYTEATEASGETAATPASVSWTTDATKATEPKTTSTDATLVFKGLADGTYTLTESTVPAGYNQAADQTITINDATKTDALKTTNLKQSKDIENNTGTALPTTGGMGTTLFTVVGAGLVIAAGVLLVTRRRMQQ